MRCVEGAAGPLCLRRRGSSYAHPILTSRLAGPTDAGNSGQAEATDGPVTRREFQRFTGCSARRANSTQITPNTKCATALAVIQSRCANEGDRPTRDNGITTKLTTAYSTTL